MSSEWKECRWGDIATIEYGKSLRTYRNDSGKYPVYGTNGLIGWHDEPLCDTPGVVVGRKGAYRGIHYSSTPFFVIDTAFYLRPKIEDLDLRFAYYELLTHDINAMDSGSAIPSTSRPEFYAMRLRLPPFSEQRAITSILGSLDDKIALNRQINSTLEAIGQALFKHWFIDFEFPDEEGKPYRSSGGEMVETELGEIPKGWKVGMLGDYIDFVKGKKPEEVSETKMEGYLPQILIETLDGGNFYYANPMNLVTCNESDIIMVMDGASSGRVEISFNGIIGSTLAKVICKNDYINNQYIYFILFNRQQEIKENTTGSAIPHADKKRILSFEIVITDKKTLIKFQEFIKGVFNKVQSNKKEVKSLAKIRDALLPKLMSGEIRVSTNSNLNNENK